MKTRINTRVIRDCQSCAKVWLILCQNYGVTLNPVEILPLMGSKEGIMHISLAFE
jgi:hypothetical protein